MTGPPDDLPPSAKFVYKMLEDHGPMTGGKLAEESRLPQSTVNDALSKLGERGLISDRPNLDDARKTVYELRG